MRERDVRHRADVLGCSLLRKRLGARVADGTAVVPAAGIGFGRAGVQLLHFRADPRRGLRLLMLGQKTDSLFSVVFTHSITRLRGSFNQFYAEKFATPRLVPSGAKWRPEPESNRRARICSPLRNHSAIGPPGGEMRSSEPNVNRMRRLRRWRASAAAAGSAGFLWGAVVRLRTSCVRNRTATPLERRLDALPNAWHVSCCSIAHGRTIRLACPGLADKSR
jgi:hypothetical protein